MVQHRLDRGIRQMLFGTDDMRDLHLKVIDHGGEIIKNGTIAAHNDGIWNQSTVPFDVSAHGVIDGDDRIAWNKKSDDIRPPLLLELLALFDG